MHHVRQAWRGEAPLWRVFWVYGMAVGVIGFFGSVAVELATAMSTGVVGTPSESNWFLYYHIWLAASECYWVWLCVSVWRCAFNVRQRIWGYGARAVAVVLFVTSLDQLIFYRIK